jgi:ribosome-associated toxin RatA of RatAB toxin-antitoxin module
MPTFEKRIEIQASAEFLFDLTQDYSRRLDWDPFLREAKLTDGACYPQIGARAWCVSKSGLGMETEYISFKRPERIAVRMTKGPRFLKTFSGSWVFNQLSDEETEVVFKYHLKARPDWLKTVIEPILVLVFSRDTERRLRYLKTTVESGLLTEVQL